RHRHKVTQVSKMAGLTPGALIHIGEQKTEHIKITVIDYNEEHNQEFELKDIDECFKLKSKNTVTWINIDGLHDIHIIERLGNCFEFHPLLMEDILNTSQRPKFEDFGDYLYFTMKMLAVGEKDLSMESEHISIIIGKNYILTFQEKEGDVFNLIRNRLRHAKGRIRKHGPDYLAYSLIDAIVDNYFVVMENIGDRITETENLIIENPPQSALKTVNTLKQDILIIRKAVWPLRDTVSGIQRSENALIHKNSVIFFRDVYDHTIQVMDSIETYRDIVSNMISVYLTSLSNKMNEVMKVLTIIATIFIPLTFIAGVYGMNFKYMPELDSPLGYPLIIVSMGLTAGIMLIFFKKKKWL
ncbi:MAG: magnesium/cobalt transporter CorA, partial [bacterium]|nr:magnesium/cobalt transporter CorA [bacterium]